MRKKHDHSALLKYMHPVRGVRLRLQAGSELDGQDCYRERLRSRRLHRHHRVRRSRQRLHLRLPDQQDAVWLPYRYLQQLLQHQLLGLLEHEPGCQGRYVPVKHSVNVITDVTIFGKCGVISNAPERINLGVSRR